MNCGKNRYFVTNNCIYFTYRLLYNTYMRNARNKRLKNSIDIAYKAALYPNSIQKTLVAKTLGCCRYLYNYCLNERITEYKVSGKSISYNEQTKNITKLKQSPDTSWLCEVDATALQRSIRHLQEAYDHFFDGIKTGRHVGFPKFKSKHESKQSYQSVNNNNSIAVIDSSHIKLPKLGIVKCYFPMPVTGTIKHATVTREADGKYSVSVMCEVVKEDVLPKTGAYVGVDLGIKSLAITSDGKTYDNPRSYKSNLKKLKREQRKLSRKQKGSTNRTKQKKVLARLHRHIKNQRHDAIHKMTHQLVKEYDVICIENLNVAGMVKNHKLAQALSDASFGEIRRQLTYKAKWNNKKLVVIDRWVPSSQTCSNCGYINKDVKNLAVRYWKCPECGEIHDRDINAAKNILAEGMKQIS